jgi:ABC-type amino acid transport substrate-binding protein
LRLFAALAVALAVICATAVPALADATGVKPIYTSLDQLKGKRIAYVNGSVYNQAMQKKVEGTSEQFYASLADCVKAVETDKADAVVQLSY